MTIISYHKTITVTTTVHFFIAGINMPTTSRYPVDWFAIIVLMVSVLVIVFLIVAAVYFYNLSNLRPPNASEASGLFAVAVVLSIILFIIVVIALYRIFTHKSLVYSVEKSPVAVPVAPAPVVMAPAPVPVVIQPSGNTMMYASMLR